MSIACTTHHSALQKGKFCAALFIGLCINVIGGDVSVITTIVRLAWNTHGGLFRIAVTLYPTECGDKNRNLFQYDSKMIAS
mmetsp:Transcript_3226/g.7136  ORF Transcript_3226/g.7136 Transcript_3226/m.7136 type:complete len:81 (+) Transcript_3226:366-608(+)